MKLWHLFFLAMITQANNVHAELNDTGVDRCLYIDTSNISNNGYNACNGSSGQDGELVKPFLFSDSSGCIFDNRTGLMWEKKTTDSSIRSSSAFFINTGTVSSTVEYPKESGAYILDVKKLVNYANNKSLCGFNDWRLPTIQELLGIVNYRSVATSNTSTPLTYDEGWFSDTNTSNNVREYWTSAKLNGSTSSPIAIEYLEGLMTAMSDSSFARARLVRQAVSYTAPNPRFSFYSDGGIRIAVDNLTGLEWQLCLYGKSWDDAQSACAGTPAEPSWMDALSLGQRMGSGWRLPNLKELGSLLNDGRSSAPYTYTANLIANTPTEQLYWTSTPNKEKNGGYKIDFRSLKLVAFSSQYSYRDGAYVRMVRDKQ